MTLVILLQRHITYQCIRSIPLIHISYPTHSEHQLLYFDTIMSCVYDIGYITTKTHHLYQCIRSIPLIHKSYPTHSEHQILYFDTIMSCMYGIAYITTKTNVSGLYHSFIYLVGWFLSITRFNHHIIKSWCLYLFKLLFFSKFTIVSVLSQLCAYQWLNIATNIESVWLV